MADLEDLHRLAPSVDPDAARAAFRGRRRRSRSLRRGLLVAAAAAALVVLAGTVGVLASRSDDDSPLVAGPGEGSGTVGPVTFEVLSVAEATDEMGTLRAAIDQQGYHELWDRSGSTEAPPSVELAEVVVVSITIPDDACPPELTAFERDGQVITPVFVEDVGVCQRPLIPKTYVVALDRSPLGDAVTLRLPASELYGFQEQRLEIDLGAASPEAEGTVNPEPAVDAPEVECGDITNFVNEVPDARLMADYTASASPEALFESSDLVLYGELTGDVEVVTSSPGTYLSFDVEPTAVYKGPDGLEPPAVVSISVRGPEALSDEEVARLKEVTLAGVPVLVFAHAMSIRPGYTASVEGFATACEGLPPIGMLGTTAEWAVITLDELTARLEAVADR